MTDRETIAKTASYVEKLFKKEGSGHDWWHIKRVWILSKTIARKEGGDLFIIEMAALMHDLDDWKFSKNNPSYRARKLMRQLKVDQKRTDAVCYILDNISFKGGFGERIKTIEGGIVQDADRIDALGAIGIARVFMYGGHKGRLLYDPQIKPLTYKNVDEFKKHNADSTTLNHFYEKLFLLEKRINTKTGKRIAVERTEYMKKYVARFMKEWKGER